MSKGFAISLSEAEKYEGQVLSDDDGWNQYKGECAAGVQYVFSKAGTPLGKTKDWKEGIKVRGGNVPAGTAIATFKDGKYSKNHAAILIKETPDGLQVWDQFKNQIGADGPKPWGIRFLTFTDKDDDYSNNGNLFNVVTK